jgi:hypothetical protein
MTMSCYRETCDAARFVWRGVIGHEHGLLQRTPYGVRSTHAASAAELLGARLR